MGVSEEEQQRDYGKKQPYVPPRFRVFRADSAQAKKLAQALSSGADDECLELITQMQSGGMESPQSLGTLGRLRKRMDVLLARVIPRPQQPQARTEQLAREIVEYARMNAITPGDVLIDVPQVAYRLRESPRDVHQSLCLLQMEGIAKRTHSKDHWKLTA